MVPECLCACPSAQLEDGVGLDAGVEAGSYACLVEHLQCEDSKVHPCFSSHVLQDCSTLIWVELLWGALQREEEAAFMDSGTYGVCVCLPVPEGCNWAAPFVQQLEDGDRVDFPKAVIFVANNQDNEFLVGWHAVHSIEVGQQHGQDPEGAKEA